MGRAEKKAIYVHIWLIHFVGQQKLTQHCKAIILQKKILWKENNRKQGICNVFGTWENVFFSFPSLRGRPWFHFLRNSEKLLSILLKIELDATIKRTAGTH